MNSEDQSILSTWVFYLRSLQLEPCPASKPLVHDTASYKVITRINGHLYNSIFLKRPKDGLALCEELKAAQKELGLGAA